jgi:probable addiction module antidote protein
MTKAKTFHASEYLTDDETIRHHLAEAFEGGNPAEVLIALANAVKAKGAKEIVLAAGLKRKTLNEALSDPCVPYAMIASIVSALGLQLTVQPIRKSRRRKKGPTEPRIASARYSRSTGKLIIEYETGWASKIPITLFGHFDALERKPRVAELQDVEVTDNQVGVRFPRLGIKLCAADFYKAVMRSN